MKYFTKILTSVLVGANVCVVFLMLLSGYSYFISPASMPFVTTLGLVFPAIMSANLLFMFIWLFLGWKKMLIGASGFLFCCVPVRMYVPINIPLEPDDDAIKVITFNSFGFRGSANGNDDTDKQSVVDYLVTQRADIVCLQEVNEGILTEEQLGDLRTVYPYIELNAIKGKAGVGILSRYPVISSDSISYESEGNMSMVYRLRFRNETLMVVNNHLESTHLSIDERNNIDQIVKGNLGSEELKSESKSVVRRLDESSITRARQAEAVSDYIAAHDGERIIVCGDFNDSPISYSYHTISKGLTDAFVTSGNWTGWSFCQSGMRVRIDHVLCSGNFKPVKCYVDAKTALSDHYPVVCWLENAYNYKKL